MIHLLSLPEDVIGDETVRQQLETLLAARPEVTAPAAGPSREENACA